LRIPSRRAVLAMAAVLCPVLAAGYAAGAQTLLLSGLFDYERLPVRSSGSTRIRQVLTGLTHTGHRLDLHVTELAPGQMPHPPHSHVHEELVLIRQGTLEVSAGARTERLGAGSAFYVASSEQHGWRNVGSTPRCTIVLRAAHAPPARPRQDHRRPTIQTPRPRASSARPSPSGCERA
jgi:quercetin dioxygenase-like cupin family protein